jgi:hypothetical protein
MAEIKSINQLLALNLNIPDYQRPYKWDVQNIIELLSDIENAIKDYSFYGDSFKYRIGTIILHKRESGVFDVVDGQQRIISFLLLKQYLSPDYSCPLMSKAFGNKVTQKNIHDNYMFIKEWFSLKTQIKGAVSAAFDDILEVVVVTVDKVSEAFQLFDSQNTRGKALDPHDLLKAYHLREMRDYPYEMEHAVKKWESKSTKDIRELFDLFLFPIWNWSRGTKSKSFTAKEIDTYKGVPETSTYTYARRASKSMPYFQITEPFIAGNDFFEMVDHYLLLLDDVRKELETNKRFERMNDILRQRNNSTGLGYTKNLFICSLLCYYDKFHNFDEMAVKKLFSWSFMLRVDMEKLGFDSVNKYAIGEENANYTNSISMFARISSSRLHSEISSIQIKVRRKDDSPASQAWNDLYMLLKEMNGIVEEKHE